MYIRQFISETKMHFNWFYNNERNFENTFKYCFTMYVQKSLNLTINQE